MQPVNIRQSDIVKIAKLEGHVTVDRLAENFAVTPQTIRKDLNDLCDAKILHRVHGGAIYPSSTANFDYLSRQELAKDGKTRIAAMVANIIPNNSSLIINIGTTTEQVAMALRNHEGLMVVTNNLNVARVLSDGSDAEVVVTGGVVRKSDGGIIGSPTIDQIKQFKVDYAIMGVSAIDEDGCLLDFDYREVCAAQAILEHSRTRILVADAMKFQRQAPVQIGRLADIDILITDKRPSKRIRKICEKGRVALKIAKDIEDA